jgi:hypothetical protein
MSTLSRGPKRGLPPLALLLLAACPGDATAPGHPVPRISTLSVAAVERGAQAPAVTVSGSDFVAASVVRVGGAERPTQFVGPTELRVTLLDTDVAGTADVAITVVNPPPGGGISNELRIAVLSPVVALGDPVTGVVSAAGFGFREYRVTGEAGAEWIAFAQTSDAPIELILVDSASNLPIARIHPFEGMAELETRSTGRVILPRTGTYLVHVVHRNPTTYRFRVDRVDRAPEEGPAAIALGAVVSEAIGSVGDIDEFAFTSSAGQELNLLVQLESGMSTGLTVDLLRGGELIERVQTSKPSGSLDDTGSGRFTLASTGEYRVRVHGATSGTGEQATGRYRFELYPVDRRPETPDALRLDGPIVLGAIDRPGDVDEFRVQVAAGQLLVIHLSSTGTVRGALRAELVDDLENTLVSAATEAWHGSSGLRYSRRYAVVRGGAHTLRVGGTFERSLASGPYSLEVYTVSAEPENASATLQIGQTVTSEAIDRPGDLDTFTFRGEAGREISIFLGWRHPEYELIAHLRRAGQEGPSTIFTWAGGAELDGASTGRMTLEDADYVLTVDPAWAGQLHLTASRGAYALRIFPIDRRPEGRSAQYALGDTVRREPLYPAGDIDEYTFELDRTRPLRIFWSAPLTGPADAVAGVLTDDASGAVLWHAFGDYPRTIMLPAGRYRMSVLNPNVRVHSDMTVPRIPSLPYRFALLPDD